MSEDGNERTALTCEDCDAPYGADGWCDVVIPNEIWNSLHAGLLCFRCMTKRLQAAGLTNVPVLVASGPYADRNEEWRLIGIDHGRSLQAEDIADLTAQLAAQAKELEEARKALPAGGAWIIVYDDRDRERELFAGHGAEEAAMKRWGQISVQWNAHLFVRMESNSRDALPAPKEAP